jgi:Phage P22-like portal protein
MSKKDAKKAQYIRRQIKLWDDAWKINRDQYYLYTTFVLGEQWTEDESRVFENYRKIPLTRNKIAPLIAHLVGEQRQNTPNLQVCPEDGVDEQTAEVREALVKDISLESNARVVYQTAFQQAAVGGFGAYVVDTEYDHAESFDQHPEFRALKDPCRAFWDTGAESPCKTDGMISGFRTRVTRKRFRSLYGKKIEVQIPTNTEENTFIPIADENTITIIDVYEREYDTQTIYQLSNNETVNSKELKELERQDIEGVEIILYKGEPVSVVDSRESPVYKVVHSKWAGDFELESRDFPSLQLPVVFVDQSSYWDKMGRQICRPFIKDAKDAQKYLNYLFTQSSYILKISRYDQFLVSKANVKSPDTQTIWRDPSTVQGGLIYDESPNGNKPEQLRPPELSASFQLQYEQACADIESCTGMYKTQLGEMGNETAGVAIDARTRRGSFNTFIPFDNLNRAIAVGGEIVNEMIPKLYNKERTLKLNMKDKGISDVAINKPKDAYGDETENDMTKGRFKIRLMPGPSYEGQKEEALQSFNQVLQADRSGQVFPMIADLYVENLPLANHIELKNRLRVMVPPQIIEAGKTGEPPPPQPQPPDPMIQIKQQEIQIKQQALQMQAQQKEHEIILKMQEIEMNAKQSGNDAAIEMQKLEHQRLEVIAQLHTEQLKSETELKKAAIDSHNLHHRNIADIVMTGAQVHGATIRQKQKDNNNVGS